MSAAKFRQIPNEFKAVGGVLAYVMRILIPVFLLPGVVGAATLSGFVTDGTSGESLPFSNVVLRGGGSPLGALGNVDGYYAVQHIPPGEYTIVVSYIGYHSLVDTVRFSGDELRELNVQLIPEPILSREIVVEADPYEAERNVQTGFVTLETAQLQELPAVGETDLLRSLQLLPGIQAASDISSGLYIRGGGPDQTLILLDQIPLYNPTHAFGFFSTFNPDAIKDMSLHKGAYPAQYGGRLGSVLDVRNRDGNRKGFEGTGGISLISARMTLEGPAGNGSWMVSGRRTYLEPVLSLIRDEDTDVPFYYFYDINAKFNHDFGDGDRLMFSGYLGRDDLNFDFEDGSFFNVRWGNTAFTGRWTHVFSPAVFGNLVVSGSRYVSNTDLRVIETPILFSNGIWDFTLKGDLDFFASSRHSLNSGFLATWFDFAYKQSFNQVDQLDIREKPFLFSAYAQDLWQPRAETSVRLGARANYFSEGDRLHFEPRFALSHGLTPALKMKLGGGSYRQYLQLVTTEAFSGGDVWVPLDRTVEPGRSWQGVTGLEWEPSRRYQLSLEGYYTDFANLVIFDNNVAVGSEAGTSEDTFVSGGTGVAAGIEFFLQKRTGSVTGWIGYTLGWTRRRFAELNGGKRFPPKYDRRHDLSFVSNWRVGRWTFGANLLYATGQAFTPASAVYRLRQPAEPEARIENYALPADRNSARLLPYHRLDLSIKRGIRLFGVDAEAYIQVFNVYSRRNEWFVQFDPDVIQSDPEVVKMLPIVPTLGFNYAF